MAMIGARSCGSVAEGRRKVTRIAALAVLLAGAVPAPARADFEAPVNLSNGAQEANYPHLAVDGAGNAVIAWYRLDGTHWQIQTRARAADGTLSAVQNLSSPGKHAILPKVAVNPGGNALIVWQRQDDNSHYRIQARYRSASGLLGLVQTLSEAGATAQNAQVAVDNDGNAVIVWYRQIGSHYHVQARYRSAAGGLGPVETLSLAGQHAVFPEVAVDADGDAVIVWRRHDGANYRIQLRHRSAAGTLGPVQNISLAGHNAFNAKVAVRGNGDAVIVWYANDGTNWRIQARARSAFGLWSRIQTLSLAGQDAGAPQVALDNDGNAVVVWQRNSGTDRIQARRRAADGTLGPIQNLSAAGEDAAEPQVAVDRDGDAVFVWKRSDGTHERIEARTLSAADTLGPIQTLSEAGQNAFTPKVAVRRANGKAVAVWSRFNGTKNRVQAAGGP
jgi:hypothetical protein